MYSDLRNKTIFDFTDDPKIIEEIIVSKEDYFERLTPKIRYYSFADLAEITNNKALRDAAEEQFKGVCTFEDYGDW